MSQKQYQKFLVTVFMVGLFLPTLKIQTYFRANEMILFGIMYAIGAYIKNYGLNGEHTAKKEFGDKIIVINVLLLLITPLACGLILECVPSVNDLWGTILAVALFARILLNPPFTCVAINRLSQSVLGVYLIHDNDFVRHFLWHDWLPNISYIHTDMVVQIFVFKVLTIFILCTLIDQIRLFFFEVPISLCLDKHWYDIRDNLRGYKDIICDKILKILLP